MVTENAETKSPLPRRENESSLPIIAEKNKSPKSFHPDSSLIKLANSGTTPQTKSRIKEEPETNTLPNLTLSTPY